MATFWSHNTEINNNNDLLRALSKDGDIGACTFKLTMVEINLETPETEKWETPGNTRNGKMLFLH